MRDWWPLLLGLLTSAMLFVGIGLASLDNRPAQLDRIEQKLDRIEQRLR